MTGLRYLKMLKTELKLMDGWHFSPGRSVLNAMQDVAPAGFYTPVQNSLEENFLGGSSEGTVISFGLSDNRTWRLVILFSRDFQVTRLRTKAI